MDPCEWRLDNARLAALYALGTRRRYPPDALLFREGDRSDHVIVVLNGMVKVFTTAESGYQTVLALRSSGEVLGEFAAFDRSPRSASVVALTEVDSVLIRGPRFRAYLRTEPDLALDLLTSLVYRLRESDRRRMEFGSLGVIGRIARLLLELADHPVKAATTAGRNTVITIALSQTELAGAIGASREAVARALRVLRDEQAIATQRQRITVLRPEVLRNLSHERSLNHQHPS
ncbi:MAG: Crp/Fnr family transcriptional regulator [Micromonosporaceae bacterium]|nr:Crp/Fnr family transcriptional regulator [Micromonosporaceae bacterium]